MKIQIVDCFDKVPDPPSSDSGAAGKVPDKVKKADPYTFHHQLGDAPMRLSPQFACKV